MELSIKMMFFFGYLLIFYSLASGVISLVRSYKEKKEQEMLSRVWERYEKNKNS